MTWIPTLKDAWWVLGVLTVILGAYWQLAIRTNKSKERLKQVAKNEESIKTLQAEMTNIKEDISDIKQGVDRQGHDNAAILSCLQTIMNALCENDTRIAPARDKFNEYLSKR